MGIKYNIKSRFHAREMVYVWNAKLALREALKNSKGWDTLFVCLFISLVLISWIQKNNLTPVWLVFCLLNNDCILELNLFVTLVHAVVYMTWLFLCEVTINLCTTKDPLTLLLSHDPMECFHWSRTGKLTMLVCVFQGVLNIQNHYSATMHYSTPKTQPDKGPIHKTDWTCSKVMSLSPQGASHTGWCRGRGAKTSPGKRSNSFFYVNNFFVDCLKQKGSHTMAHIHFLWQTHISCVNTFVNYNTFVKHVELCWS